MDALVPLPVAIPLLAAALLAALNFLHNRTFADIVGIAVAAAATVICASVPELKSRRSASMSFKT